MKSKKNVLICVLIGLLMITVSVLTIVVTINTDHYTATITEISDSYTTHSKSGKSRRTQYNEKVTVTYVNSDDEHLEAKGVRVKRNSETQLPDLGETIEVTDNIFGVREYRTLTPLTVAGTLIVLGLLVIILGFKTGKKKKPDTPEITETSEITEATEAPETPTPPSDLSI